MAGKKFYVVWTGRQQGIFSDWPAARASVERFAGARYKSFPTYAEAERAFKGGKPAASRAGSRAKTAPVREAPALDAQYDLQIYCDGACEPNPGHAGSGIAVYRHGKVSELWYGLHNPHGTNNTAELNALHYALRMAERALEVEEGVEILSDSKYSLSCIDLWAPSWEKRGWKKSGGEIKNLAIIQASYALYGRLKPSVRLTHIRGHAGVEGNELADRMAMLAVQTRQDELMRFPGKIDVPSILRMRAG